MTPNNMKITCCRCCSCHHTTQPTIITLKFRANQFCVLVVDLLTAFLQALLQFNALQNATDKEGRTPLDYAMALEEGADEMVAILEGLCSIALTQVECVLCTGHATDSTAEKPGVDITTSESSSNSKICVLL